MPEPRSSSGRSTAIAGCLCFWLLVIMTGTIVANLKHIKERIHVPADLRDLPEPEDRS